MSDIKVIAHTHWDKEWYFTDNRSMVYSLVDFDEIIDYLTRNPDFETFLLDGQTSIIEDYLRYRPERKDELIKLIKEKRLITGPWYTQSDTLVISGESLIRNLLIGKKESEALGGYQKIGYLPDSFGMSEQLPLIYTQMGLDYAFFRRGIADHLIKDREFIWQSPSGDRIKTFNLFHYGIMAYPPNEDDGSYIDSLVEKLEKFGNRKPYILFNGEDQKPIRKNIKEIIKHTDYTAEISSLEDALDDVFDKAEDLNVYGGEFTFGQHSRTHKSIFSTRADLKQKHNHLERYLSLVVEPISSIAYKLGLRYEKELIDEAWKLMLLNSAHDSIGMCNSDATNKFIEYRYDKVEDLTTNLVDSIMRRIGDGINCSNFAFQIYNTHPYQVETFVVCELLTPFENFKVIRDGKEIDFYIENISRDDTNLTKSIKEIGVNNESSSKLTDLKAVYKVKIVLFDQFNSMGYQTYEIVEADKKADIIEETDDLFIENEYYKLSVDDHGRIKVQGNSNISIIYLENNGDEGDSYDYSSPKHDLFISKGEVKDLTTRKTKFEQCLSYTLVRKIPSDLKNRETNNFDSKIESKISLYLYKGDNSFKINYKTTNNAIEHRDRLVIDTKIQADRSIADQQFGTIIREVDYDKYNYWKEEGWDEKPRGIEPMLSFAALKAKETVMAVTDSVREYEVLDNNKLAITMFRSVPYLGKPDLNDRPGRASGVHEIQMGHALLGTEISTNIYIRDITCDYYNMHKFANKVLNPPIAYQAGEIYDNTDHFVISKNNSYNESYSLLEVENALFSTLKMGEYTNDLILRLYNPNREDDLLFNINYDKLEFLKADEKTTDRAEKSILPCGIKTIKLM